MQREDDKPDVVQRRLAKYEAETSPLKDYYARHGLLHRVDGVGSPDAIYQQIRQATGKAA